MLHAHRITLNTPSQTGITISGVSRIFSRVVGGIFGEGAGV